mgnify:CR=1 FL=1
MDRKSLTRTQIEQRFPHTRGDGPKIDPHYGAFMAFSPHPWGWTVAAGRAGVADSVFPTPVGMDLLKREGDDHIRRFPHTRGDGPRAVRSFQLSTRFSPHPWGWTADIKKLLSKGLVFPTPVGMDRDPAATISASPSFPHTRGDGP